MATELIAEDVQTLRTSFSSGKTRSAEWRMTQLVLLSFLFFSFVFFCFVFFCFVVLY